MPATTPASPVGTNRQRATMDDDIPTEEQIERQRRESRRLDSIRVEVLRGIERVSATQVATVVDDSSAALQQQIRLLSDGLASIVKIEQDRASKMLEELIALREQPTRSDPHVLLMQKTQLAMIQRDMVHLSRPMLWLWGAITAALIFGNLVLGVAATYTVIRG